MIEPKVLVCTGDNPQLTEIIEILKASGVILISCSSDPIEIQIGFAANDPVAVLLDNAVLDEKMIMQLCGTFIDDGSSLLVYHFANCTHINDSGLKFDSLNYSKVFFPYDAKEIAEEILMVASTLPTDWNEYYSKLKLQVCTLIEDFHFKHYKYGYNYIVDSIALTAIIGDDNVALSKQVYPYLAEIYDVNRVTLERSIRLSLRSCAKKSPEKFTQIFGESKCGFPPNKKFIMYFAKIAEKEFANLIDNIRQSPELKASLNKFGQ